MNNRGNRKHFFVEAGGLTYCECGASPFTPQGEASCTRGSDGPFACHHPEEERRRYSDGDEQCGRCGVILCSA